MNILFRWFVGPEWDDDVFDHSILSKNGLRLLADGAAQAFLGEVVRLAQRGRLLQSDWLVEDGTLIKANERALASSLLPDALIVCLRDSDMHPASFGRLLI